MATLEEIVATDNKGRFAFNEDKSKIRAVQGHSFAVGLQLEEKRRPILCITARLKNIWRVSSRTE